MDNGDKSCGTARYQRILTAGKDGTGMDGFESCAASAAAYIEAHYRTVTVEELADYFGYSTSHFRRLFVKAHGIPPREYIFRYKMEKARELLLADPDRSVEEIAVMLGMYNAAHFCRIFRRRMGCTPREYRIASGILYRERGK